MKATDKREPIDLAILCSMLDFIPSELPRDEWARLLMAAKSEFGDQAKMSMQAWSAKSSNYDKTGFNSTWKSINASGGVTIASLIQTAKEHGYRFAPMEEADRKRLLKEQRARDKLRLEQEKSERADRQKRYEEAAQSAKHFLKERAIKANPNHPYLEKKGLGNAIYDVQATSFLYQCFNTLIVPVYRFDKHGRFEVCSLQYIDENGGKFFLKGGQTKGGFFPLRFGGHIISIVICEGLATGLTYAKHYDPLSEIIVAFNAKNLKPVACDFKRMFPMARIIIAGDNDLKTEKKSGFNPGVKSAKEAAHAIDGALSIPHFEDGESGSDWNDRYLLDVQKQTMEAVNESA